jgi:mannose-1-phosphate guanylyltransferase
MVQRVYRQIHEAGIEAPIVIATGSSQADSIRNHLGNNVEVVIEPERRNTFPAIALSVAYLALEKRVNVDEVVVVLPVDPYAEDAYFKTLLRMEKAIKNNTAGLVLMGIQPTYPSAKYGYIVPTDIMSEPRPVARFIEKPTEAQAVELIDKGAVWNGGVFAFRIGWLMDIISKYVNTGSYVEVYSNYSKLTKTSFDYEVVEKANSIAMVSYHGIWKDLGTWNTLSEEMYSTSIGKAIIGEGTENTIVINELDIPVVALGLKDIVVAASPDGILVSGKNESSYLKLYVDHLDQRPMYEERRWGEFKIIDYNQYSGKNSLTRHMFIKSGKNTNYQVHAQRDEIWTFIDGAGELLIDGHIRNVRVGDVAYITRGQKHAIKAITDLHFIEVQIGEELTEEDSNRFEWEW